MSSPAVSDPMTWSALPALSHTSALQFLLIEDSSADSELVQALLEIEFPNADIDTVASLDLALTRAPA